MLYADWYFKLGLLSFLCVVHQFVVQQIYLSGTNRETLNIWLDL